MKKIKSQIGGVTKSRENASSIDSEINDIFSMVKKSRYKELWDRYYSRVSQKSEDERIRVEPFFGFEVMYHHMGYRSWIDAGPGICVSIGVLGTFVGLSTGLSDLHVGDTEALRTGIGSLIDGMKIAFFTSVFGVFLSLIWTFIDRFVSQKLDTDIDWHTEKMDYLLNTDDEELFLNRLEKISRKQADHMKTLLTDAMEKAMQPMVAQMQQSNGQMQDAFSQLNEQFSSISEGMQNQSGLLQSQIDLTKNNSSNMTNRLVEQITGGTQESISQFSSLMNETQNMQKQMIGTLNQVVDSFVKTEEKQSQTTEQTYRMFSQFENMSKELEQMRDSYQDTSVNMTSLSDTIQRIQQLTEQQLPVQQDVMKSNQSLADKYENLTEGFKSFNEKIEKKHEDLLNEVITVSTSMTNTYRDMTDRFAKSLKLQKESMYESEQLLSSVKEVVANLTPIAPDLKGVVSTIDTLKNQLQETQKLQDEILPELVNLRSQTNERIEGALETTKGYMYDMTTQIETMQLNWSSVKEQFESTREGLDTSLKNFSENIDNGLSKTYEHFDGTLTSAVNQVSSFINHFGEMQEDLVDGLDDLAEALNRNREVIKQ
ncbi:hypothetical protein [Gracilibacillus ureilyticus]|nr:hypothetical protein [Gracilibacillus ureilyticus]